MLLKEDESIILNQNLLTVIADVINGVFLTYSRNYLDFISHSNNTYFHFSGIITAQNLSNGSHIVNLTYFKLN